MASYAIDDTNGSRLTAGLREHNAPIVAQRMANERGESVYLYETGESETDSESIEYQPEGK